MENRDRGKIKNCDQKEAREERERNERWETERRNSERHCLPVTY